MLDPEYIELLGGFLAGLRPEPMLTVSEWADQHRYLSPVASSEPGPWRTTRTPHIREIMDKLSSNDPTQEVVFMKASQVAGTEAGNNWLGYVMDVAPGAFLFVMPTDDTVKRNSKIRIAPMIEATPRLRAKVGTSKSRDGDNNIYQKSFPGGVVVLTGANSASGLRSLPARYLMLDEVDAYPEDLDGEGSPIELARRRTSTFAKRKILIVSTPTIEGASAIQREYLKTDQRKYFVHCVHCGGSQELIFEQLKWEEGKPETVQYECVHCNERMEEREKPHMFKHAEWIPTCPENSSPKKVGYHLNSLYSPYGWYSWDDIARDYEAAKKDPSQMKTFVNTVLGQCYRETGEVPPWENLYNRRENYELNKVPSSVVFITAGVDIQKDRIELEVVGWCPDKSSYSLDFRVLLGETSGQDVWNELAKVVTEQWTRADGMQMPLRLMAVDTGYNTQHVYNFCNRYDHTRVIPIKGQDSQSIPVAPPRAVNYTSAGKKLNKTKLWNVGVSVLKSELYSWLLLERNEDGVAPFGFCHFPEYDQQYFKGLTAEELQYKVVRGFRKYEWVKKIERNEPLDCRIYARAAATVVGLDRLTTDQLQAMGGVYVQRKSDTQRKDRRKSGFWD